MHNNCIRIHLTAILLLVGFIHATAAERQKPKRVWPEKGKETALYINNGKIQIGVDPERGGAIFHFSDAKRKSNILNHADEGRFVQQSYYGNADGSTWWDRPWCWNPIQGGGSKGRKARILKKEQNATRLHIITEPVLWASNDPAPECLMEEDIRLEGKIAHITYTFRNTGDNARDHDERHQEVPAVFIDWDYPYFVYYDGKRPWSNDTLRKYIPKLLANAAAGESANLAESWAAYVNSQDQGIGVYTPNSKFCTLYRFGTGPGGPESGSCSYFAPLVSMAIKKGMTYSYDVYLTIGTVRQIRNRFYQIHSRLLKNSATIK